MSEPTGFTSGGDVCILVVDSTSFLSAPLNGSRHLHLPSWGEPN